jgi:hypothetical protein
MLEKRPAHYTYPNTSPINDCTNRSLAAAMRSCWAIMAWMSETREAEAPLPESRPGTHPASRRAGR